MLGGDLSLPGAQRPPLPTIWVTPLYPKGRAATPRETSETPHTARAQAQVQVASSAIIPTTNSALTLKSSSPDQQAPSHSSVTTIFPFPNATKDGWIPGSGERLVAQPLSTIPPGHCSPVPAALPISCRPARGSPCRDWPTCSPFPAPSVPKSPCATAWESSASTHVLSCDHWSFAPQSFQPCPLATS